MPKYDDQYHREVQYAEATYKPSIAAEMKMVALERFRARQQKANGSTTKPARKPKSKTKPKKKTSKLSSVLGTLSKAATVAKEVSGDMHRAIAYELSAPPPKRIRAKKPKKTVRKTKAKKVTRSKKAAKRKKRAAKTPVKKPPTFAVKSDWM